MELCLLSTERCCIAWISGWERGTLFPLSIQTLSSCVAEREKGLEDWSRLSLTTHSLRNMSAHLRTTWSSHSTIPSFQQTAHNSLTQLSLNRYTNTYMDLSKSNATMLSQNLVILRGIDLSVIISEYFELLCQHCVSIIIFVTMHACVHSCSILIGMSNNFNNILRQDPICEWWIRYWFYAQLGYRGTVYIYVTHASYIDDKKF